MKKPEDGLFPEKRGVRKQLSTSLRDVYELARDIGVANTLIAEAINRAGGDIPTPIFPRSAGTLNETWRILYRIKELSLDILEQLSKDSPATKKVTVRPVSTKDIEEIEKLPKARRPIPSPIQVWDPKKPRRWRERELMQLSRKQVAIIAGVNHINPFKLKDKSKRGLIDAVLSAQEEK